MLRKKITLISIFAVPIREDLGGTYKKTRGLDYSVRWVGAVRDEGVSDMDILCVVLLVSEQVVILKIQAGNAICSRTKTDALSAHIVFIDSIDLNIYYYLKTFFIFKIIPHR